MIFELWDQSSGSLLGEFAQASEAFDLVEEIRADEGMAGVQSLALLVSDDHGQTKLVAEAGRLMQAKTIV